MSLSVLPGQRNAKQAETASKAADARSEKDAQWVRKVYRGED